MPPGPYRIEQLGADVLDLLDDLRLDRVSFCGLSLGGMVGMWLAANAPERIEWLALCCTSAKVDPATPRPHAEAIVAAIGGAWLEVVAGAAHLANIEQPQRVTGQLLDHFTDPSAT